MTRRELVASLAVAVWPLTTSAQQARTPVVGFLGLGSPATVGPALLAAPFTAVSPRPATRKVAMSL